MSDERKPRSVLERLLETKTDRKRELKRERQRIAGQITGTKNAIKRREKIIRICEAATKLTLEGEPERGLNKKIARLTKLPYEYVMKVMRAINKEY